MAQGDFCISEDGLSAAVRMVHLAYIRNNQAADEQVTAEASFCRLKSVYLIVFRLAVQLRLNQQLHSLLGGQLPHGLQALKYEVI